MGLAKVRCGATPPSVMVLFVFVFAFVCVCVLQDFFFQSCLPFVITSEIVKPYACSFSSSPSQAVWVVTTGGVHPNSAPITGAPFQITPRQCGS